MSLDRKAELLMGAHAAPKPEDQMEKYKDEENPQEDTLDGNSMSRWLSQVRSCQSSMKEVKVNMARQLEIKTSFKEKADKASEKSLMDEFERINLRNSSLCQETAARIKALEQEYKRAAAELPDEPETRMKEAQIVSLTTNITEVLSQSQSLSVDFKQIVKDKLKRQIKNADHESKISDQQIDSLAEKDPDALHKMVEVQLLGKAHLKVENAVRDIEEKCKGIEQLHENIRKIYELIKEISEIVHQQGEQVDLILKNVEKSKDYVDKGNKNLLKAKDYHQKARKKQCCIILIAVVFLCILLAPVLSTIIK